MGPLQRRARPGKPRTFAISTSKHLSELLPSTSSLYFRDYKLAFSFILGFYIF